MNEKSYPKGAAVEFRHEQRGWIAGTIEHVNDSPRWPHYVVSVEGDAVRYSVGAERIREPVR